MPELSLDRREAAPGKIETLLLATDLTSASDVATGQSIDMAAAIKARLLVVHVLTTGADWATDGAHAVLTLAGATRVDQERARRERPLLAIIDRARARGVDAAFLLWTGEPGQSIVAAAQAESADLIVVGTRGLDDAGRFLLGSVSDYVVYHSTCPVLVAH